MWTMMAIVTTAPTTSESSCTIRHQGSPATAVACMAGRYVDGPTNSM